jgi:asparagine synthase (glutamine-hydrolysing)
MCGLAGIVGSYPSDVADNAIKAMTQAQHHRGPDDGGTEVLESGAGSVALGARRLAIIDLTAAGHQPMRDELTGNVLAYNGEIYNFLELKSELAAKGHTFSGRGDTEVLLIGYREWGIGVLDRLRGMFGFALWDAQKRCLIVARDHLGIKPLYYSFTNDGFVCASELKALLAGGLVDASLDRRALAGFFAYGSVQEPLTICEQVKALPAGSWLEIDAHGKQIGGSRYWDFPAIDHSPGSEAELVAEGRHLLERSVERHLLSDVPLGVFLSSGIDSTAVAGLARQMSDHDVHAFTVSFPGAGDLDEAPIAEATAKRLDLVFHDIAVDSSTCVSWAEAGLASMDQPAMDGLNAYIVSRAVREAGLTVALSGQGGDEVFGGYQSFELVPKFDRLAAMSRFMPRALRGSLARAVTQHRGYASWSKAQDVASMSDLPDMYLMLRRGLADRDMRSLGLDAQRMDLTTNFLSAPSRDTIRVDGDSVASVGRLETTYYLGNTLLRDGDVYGMANSLEIRVPFLDRDVVDWAFKLPGDVLLPKDGKPKHLLRRMCADVLGPDQLDRPKRGFGLPIASWMEGPLRDLKNESLAAVIDSGLVDETGVRAIERHYGGDNYRSSWTRVWTLVALGQWLQQTKTLITR